MHKLTPNPRVTATSHLKVPSVFHKDAMAVLTGEVVYGYEPDVELTGELTGDTARQ